MQKGVHFVDLGESFPTHIYLQNLASIQPRTSGLPPHRRRRERRRAPQGAPEGARGLANVAPHVCLERPFVASTSHFRGALTGSTAFSLTEFHIRCLVAFGLCSQLPYWLKTPPVSRPRRQAPDAMGMVEPETMEDLLSEGSYTGEDPGDKAITEVLFFFFLLFFSLFLTL